MDEAEGRAEGGGILLGLLPLDLLPDVAPTFSPVIINKEYLLQGHTIRLLASQDNL